jgi:hypothetical protein
MLTSRSLAFGDSYTYVQGTGGLQNYSFIGDLQNFTYTPQQLLTDEIVQNQVTLFIPMTSSIPITYVTFTDWYFSRRT